MVIYFRRVKKIGKYVNFMYRYKKGVFSFKFWFIKENIFL